MTLYEPSDAECLNFEYDLQRRIDNFVRLETARRELCVYTADPCDCKYGAAYPPRPGTEKTGCPELRDLIFRLTGWRVFIKHPSRTPQEHAEMLAERSRDAWLRFYDGEVKEFAESPSTRKETT